MKTVVYQLKKNREEPIEKGFGVSDREKKCRNLYLEVRHWDFLDNLADELEVSRNQALRIILNQIVEDEGVVDE